MGPGSARVRVAVLLSTLVLCSCAAEASPGPSADPVTAPAPRPPARTSTGPGSTTPPAAAPGDFALWISETVVPVAGADVAAVLLGTGTEHAMFGVLAAVDRWDGSAWRPHRLARMCPDHWHCRGDLKPADAKLAIRTIGLPVGPGGTGPTGFLRIEGLDPGRYRLRHTANEGAQASGRFRVVEGDVPTAPLGDLDTDRLLVLPALLPRGGGMLSVDRSREDASAEEAAAPAFAVGARLALQTWRARRWRPAGTLTPTGPWTGHVGGRRFRLPPVTPGAYRLVDHGQRPTAYGVFWVTAGGRTVSGGRTPSATAPRPTGSTAGSSRTP